MMGLFGRKKSKREELEEARRKALEAKRAELKKIISSAELRLPEKKQIATKATEYREFLAEIKEQPKNLFERLCSASARILPVDPPAGIARSMDDDIKTGYLGVTPRGVLAFSILTFFMLFIATFLSLVYNLGFFTVMLVIIMIGAFYYIFTYPSANAKKTILKMSADSVLAVLYMIIYMRTSPNMEGAIKFASENLKGPLAWDLKKLLWDINVGVYSTADAAIASYIDKWKGRNEEFAEALNLLRGSVREKERREKLFEETLSVILNGTMERTKHYVGGLRMPVMLIHAMGVLLPVMGLVLFPIIVIFMADVIKPAMLFLGYNFILPVFLWVFIDYILKARPPTFSQPDISLARGVPPMGKLRIGGALVPIWVFSLMVLLPLMAASIYTVGPCISPASAEVELECTRASFANVNLSLLVTAAISMSIVTYCVLDSLQKMKIRSEIEKIENEFSVALFQLGNQISEGTPIELAIERASANMKGMKIADLFKITSENMKKFGYTFEQALFDKEVGAVWHYPSRLIRSIMSTILESSKKGMAATSSAMLTISKYLDGVHEVKEEVNSVLGETLSSMRFLATILTPLVAGVTITMAVVIINILSKLGSQIAGLVSAGGEGMNSFQYSFMFGPSMMGGKMPIGPAEFQIIVGIYMIETIILLSVFVNRIEFGDDAVGLRSTLGRTLTIGVLIYVISWLVTYGLFGPAITSLLTPETLNLAASGG
ncbi:MAG: hypothetical protein QXU82_01485 [Candidatus Aenigmatarchaeota archaeon]